MNKTCALVIISLLFLLTCKKQSSTGTPEVEGILTGPDLTMCPCCGGTFIKIQTNTYRIDSLPASLNGPFPINVSLTYTIAPYCNGWYIKSNDIRRR
jgi:hypothetical protein